MEYFTANKENITKILEELLMEGAIAAETLDAQSNPETVPQFLEELASLEAELVAITQAGE